MRDGMLQSKLRRELGVTAPVVTRMLLALRALGCFGQHRDPGRRLVQMDALDGLLRALRRDLGDGATLTYLRGHPDD